MTNLQYLFSIVISLPQSPLMVLSLPSSHLIGPRSPAIPCVWFLPAPPLSRGVPPRFQDDHVRLRAPSTVEEERAKEEGSPLLRLCARLARPGMTPHTDPGLFLPHSIILKQLLSTPLLLCIQVVQLRTFQTLKICVCVCVCGSTPSRGLICVCVCVWFHS